jgi:hypothetical protein
VRGVPPRQRRAVLAANHFEIGGKRSNPPIAAPVSGAR